MILLQRRRTPIGASPGDPDYIEPGSPQHNRLISPSKVAAILGVSRWESPYGLWMRMAGRADPVPHKDIFDIGHAFELALAELWKYDNPKWQLSPRGIQMRTDEFGFPALVTLDRRARSGPHRRVVEFKITHSLEDWGDEFTDECPEDYKAQVIAQQLFTGYTDVPAHLVVLGPFHKHHTYEIPFDESIAELIIDECGEFYTSLGAGEVPDLDDSVATYDCVRSMHPDITRGEEVPVPIDLIIKAREARDEVNNWEGVLRGLKTQIWDRMGNAQYAVVGRGKDKVRVADRRNHARGGVALNMNNKPLPDRAA